MSTENSDLSPQTLILMNHDPRYFGHRFMENRHYVNNALHNEDQIERMSEHFISHQLALCCVSNTVWFERYEKI